MSAVSRLVGNTFISHDQSPFSMTSIRIHSIARALFPCHQTDSRSVGKFVPVESGTYSITVQVALRW